MRTLAWSCKIRFKNSSVFGYLNGTNDTRCESKILQFETKKKKENATFLVITT